MDISRIDLFHVTAGIHRKVSEFSVPEKMIYTWEAIFHLPAVSDARKESTYCLRVIPSLHELSVQKILEALYEYVAASGTDPYKRDFLKGVANEPLLKFLREEISTKKYEGDWWPK